MAGKKIDLGDDGYIIEYIRPCIDMIDPPLGDITVFRYRYDRHGNFMVLNWFYAYKKEYLHRKN